MKLQFVSCTFNRLERTSESRRYIEFSSRSILSPQDPQQNRNLGTIPTCTVGQYFPHDNIAGSHSCCECTRSTEPSVCHKHWSISSLLVQVCSQTKILVCRCAPSRGFVQGDLRANFLQFSPTFPAHFLELMVVKNKVWRWRPCTTARCFCLPTRSTVPRISSHVLSYR